MARSRKTNRGQTNSTSGRSSTVSPTSLRKRKQAGEKKASPTASKKTTSSAPKSPLRSKRKRRPSAKLRRSPRQSSPIKSTWSTKEDERLTKAVLQFKDKNWAAISKRVRGKTHLECLHRWREVLQPRQKAKEGLKKRAKQAKVNPTNGDAELNPLWKKYLKTIVSELHKIRLPKALLDAYESEGWKRSNHERVRPQKELEKARLKILNCKKKIRDLLVDLTEGEEAQKEYKIDDNGDSDIDADNIICAICRLGDEEGEDNDIVMCDLEGCNKAFHQKCMDPPLSTEVLENSADWFCPRCNCKLHCLNAINDEFETDYDDVHTLFKADFEKGLEESKKRGAWDTHSFSSKSDSEFEMEEPDGAEESNSEDEEDSDSEEEPLILTHKRRRTKVDYVKLADALFNDSKSSEEESSDGDFNSGSSTLDEKATLRSVFS